MFMLCLSFLAGICVYTAAENSIKTFKVPLPQQLRQAMIHISNDNSHTITQYNTNTMNVTVPQKHSPGWLDTISNIWCYKEKIALVLPVASYGLLYARLLWQTSVIKRTDTWAAWRAQVPLSVLCKIEPDIVRSELVTTIKERYALCGSAIPEQLFLHDVAQELAQLQSFFAVYDWVTWSKISYLVPRQLDIRQKVGEGIERLIFLQNIIQLKCAEAA